MFMVVLLLLGYMHNTVAQTLGTKARGVVFYESGVDKALSIASKATIVVKNNTQNTEKEVAVQENGNFLVELEKGKEYVIYATNGSLYSKPQYLNVASKAVKSQLILVLKHTAPIWDSSNLVTGMVQEEKTLSYKDIEFKIHLGNYARPLPEQSYFLLAVKEEIKHVQTSKKSYLYFFDGFENYEKTVMYLAKLKSLGYHNPKVVVYANSQPSDFTVNEALEFVKAERHNLQD